MIPKRSDYEGPDLTESDLLASPFDLLGLWIDAAAGAGLEEPTAMCVATCNSQGRPSSRMVLMRGLDERGVVFFTHYASRKGRELSENPFASATFWWPSFHRQVRVEGRVERASAEESDAYFTSRPRQSQLASAASPQSERINSRAELEDCVRELDARFSAEVPRPENWGGFRIVPNRFEFWQGRPARLHDRFEYLRIGQSWKVQRLAP